MIRGDGDGDVAVTLQKFDLSKRKVDKFLDEVNDYSISSDGSKMLYRKGEQFVIVATAEPPSGDKGGPPKPGEGPLKLDSMQVYIEPRAMWKQQYHEAWRIERDFLYDPNHHGLDLAKAEKKYAPYIDGLGSRDELNYLFEDALGEIQVGHVFVFGGFRPEVKPVKTGLLGADYRIENDRYRVARVYNGENWNPDLQAPLTQPGVNVQVGDYILAVAGREVHGTDDLDSFFEGQAGKQVSLKVGPNPDGKGAREVTVVPIDSEIGLRRLAWVEGNRRKVDELTGGRVAYVHLPNTGGGGFSSFNRYYYAQVGKDAAILDERFNEGGDLADYIIDALRRPLMSLAMTREGDEFTSPGAAIYGPKVMIINEMAGSGGDAQPWYFRKAGYWAADRQADLGWPGRYLGISRLHRRRRSHRSPRRHLWPQRRLGGRRPRHQARLRRGPRSGGGSPGTRSATGEGGRGRHGPAQEKSLAAVQTSAVSEPSGEYGPGDWEVVRGCWRKRSGPGLGTGAVSFLDSLSCCGLLIASRRRR